MNDVKQFLFDKAVSGLLAQGELSLADGTCAYRGENGLKCGIGFLIADEFYDPDIEGNTAVFNGVIEAVVKSNGIKEDLSADDICFLGKIQNVHDAKSPWEWKPEFKNLAKRYGLTWNH